MSDVSEHYTKSDTCIIAFASGGGEFSGDLPHFEFGNSLRDMDVSYVLIRDSAGFSCQFGVQGIGNRVDVCDFINRLCDTYKRVITIGLSVGSLCALMYAQMTRVNEVIALSPFTSLGDNPDVVFGGAGWRERCPFDTNVPIYTDILPLFENGPRCKVKAFISDGEGTEHDRWMAMRIGIDDITLIPGTSHSGLGKKMRDEGIIRRLILNV